MHCRSPTTGYSKTITFNIYFFSNNRLTVLWKWYNCNFFYGDGYEGLPNLAPFDKIIVTCGAPTIPEDLIKQLKVGGRMVAPIGKGDVQVMNLIEKISETEIKITTHGEFSFVPMINNKNNGN